MFDTILVGAGIAGATFAHKVSKFAKTLLTLPEMFYSLENGEKIFCTIISNIGAFDFFIVLLFEKIVPLGMAEMNLFKCSKAIEKLILDEIDLVL